eukprot:TRINITY_DN46927_c0_g1_i1.p1 TRINITY_DN46927_c0_g1~~TRINITY_DN46927_c0_g1_i1.p1  ORF type:complete len:496 (+),score=137.95 TRINITY_DN46927_c0_g1_i1:99-1490(+)
MTYGAVDAEPQAARVPPRHAVLLSALVNVMGGMLFGYVAIGCNAAAGVLWACLYGLQGDWGIAGLQSLVNVGAAAGSLGGGYLWTTLGLRRTLLIGCVLTLSCLLTGRADTYMQQSIARIVSGAGVGVLSCAAPTYVEHMSQYYFSARVSGRVGCLFQVSLTLGLLAACVVGYVVLGPLRDEAPWPSGADAVGYCGQRTPAQHAAANFALFVPGVLAALVGVLLCFVIDESPVWLEGQSSGPDAKPAAAAEDTPRRTWILSFMGSVAQQLTGINAVMFYSTRFFEAAHFEQKLLGSVFVMLWNFLSTVAAVGLISRFGRRGLMNIGLVLMAMSITLLTPVDEWIQNDALRSALCFICLAAYVLGFEVGPGSLFWVYLPEVAPKGSPVFAFATTMAWVFSLLVTFCFPPLQAMMQGYVFLFFAVPSAACVVFHYFCLPETGGHENQAAARRLMKNDPPGPWLVP